MSVAYPVTPSQLIVVQGNCLDPSDVAVTTAGTQVKTITCAAGTVVFDATSYPTYQIDADGKAYVFFTSSSTWATITLPVANPVRRHSMTLAIVSCSQGNGKPINNFKTWLASTSATAGLQCRWGKRTSTWPNPFGGSFTANDGTLREHLPNSSAGLHGHEGAKGSCNVLVRDCIVWHTVTTNFVCYFNNASTTSTVARGADGSGDITALYWGKSHTGTLNSDQEGFYEIAIWDTSLSAANAASTVTALVAEYPLVSGMVADVPHVFWFGTSFIAGFGAAANGTSNDSNDTYWDYLYQTLLPPSGRFTWSIHGMPGVSTDTVTTMLNRNIASLIRPGDYVVVDGANNQIAAGATPAATKTSYDALYAAIRAAEADAIIVFPSTSGRGTENADRQTFNTTMEAEFEATPIVAGSVWYRGLSAGDFDANTYWFNYADDVLVGDHDAVDSVTGWSDIEAVAGQPVSKSGRMKNDYTHYSGHTHTYPGQERLAELYEVGFSELMGFNAGGRTRGGMMGNLLFRGRGNRGR